MISFWFAHVFEQPAIRELDYYVRLDTDSKFTAPIPYDFIRYAHQHRIEYGYRFQTEEEPGFFNGLWDFVANYTASHGVPIPPTLTLPEPSQRATTRPMVYFNNVEVVHVPLFTQRRDIRSFMEAVVASHGIYLFRWGDAPLRYLTLQLFLEKPAEQIHFYCDLPYMHRIFPCHPICRSPGGNETITLTKQNDCHLGRW